MHLPYISLRKKLPLLLLFALLSTTLPLIYLSFNAITEDERMGYRNRVEDFFHLVKLVIENDKDSRELVKDLSIKDRTSTLRVISASFTYLLEDLLQKNAHTQEVRSILRNLESTVKAEYFLLQAQGEDFSTSIAGNGKKIPNLTTKMQESDGTLRDVLHTALQQEAGVTSFMPVENSSYDESMLVFAQRLGASNHVLLAISPLDDFYHIEETLAEKLYRNLKDSYDKLDILDDGFLIVYNAFTKKIEASAGEVPKEIHAFLMRPHAPKEAEYLHTENMGEFHVYTSNSIEQSYYFTVGLSQHTVFSLTTSLQNEQFPIFILILVLGTLLWPLCARASLNSLESLTKLARVLPQKDFTKDFPLNNFHLPLERGDEIGDLARSFANMSNLLHENVKSLVTATAQQSRLETELKAARTLQEDFLPKPLTPCPLRPYAIFAHLLPAREIGGDLYDYTMIDEDTLFFCIGDVSGKGMPSALVMGMTIILARAAVKMHMPPHEAMAFINSQLCQSNRQQMFVSLFLGQYNIKEGKVQFSLAGHPAPLIFGKHAARKVPVPHPNLVVGLMPDVTYDAHEIHLEAGESLLLYTDGISEAVNTQNNFYGEEKLLQLCDTLPPNSTVETIATTILDAVHVFAADTAQADDMTLVLLQKLSTPEKG